MGSSPHSEANLVGFKHSTVPLREGTASEPGSNRLLLGSQPVLLNRTGASDNSTGKRRRPGRVDLEIRRPQADSRGDDQRGRDCNRIS
jgi:hypothetical protein